MNRLNTLFFCCAVLILCACEKSKDPVEVHVVYKVEYQGEIKEVHFHGELNDTFFGYCRFTDSGEATFPKALTFRLLRNTGLQDNHELQLSKLRMREVPQEENLPCDGLHINFNAVEEAHRLQCGPVDDGRCEIIIVVYDKKEERIEGKFSCGEFHTTAISTSGSPVPMKILDGTFSFTHCN